MIRYAITDGAFVAGSAQRWAAGGVSFIQLRDRMLGAAALAGLARRILVETAGTSVQLLVNGRVDVALAVGAAGVHLSARVDELSVDQVRRVFALASGGSPVVSVSCHTLAEALRARDGGADMILFAPVFEKRVQGEVVAEGAGLDELRRVCAAVSPVRVLALGGVTAEKAGLCVEAGAAGVAGIRMFG